MKTLVFISFIVLLAAGLFFAGWRLGYHEREVSQKYAVPLLDWRLADAGSKATILHLMDLGHYSDARAIIQGQFNNEILNVAFDADYDLRGPEFTRRTCAMIVSFRNAYPSNYLSHPELGDTWTVDQVNAYLKRMTQPNTSLEPTPTRH